MKTKFFAIKTPEKSHLGDRTYWFIGISKLDSWNLFFTEKPHRYPLEEAIRAYEAIGYKCVEVKIEELNENNMKG